MYIFSLFPLRFLLNFLDRKIKEWEFQKNSVFLFLYISWVNLFYAEFVLISYVDGAAPASSLSVNMLKFLLLYLVNEEIQQKTEQGKFKINMLFWISHSFLLYISSFGRYNSGKFFTLFFYIYWINLVPIFFRVFLYWHYYLPRN